MTVNELHSQKRLISCLVSPLDITWTTNSFQPFLLEYSKYNNNRQGSVSYQTG